jgi:hypothetical protein
MFKSTFTGGLQRLRTNLKIVIAIPILLVIGIAGPASTREAMPAEREKIEQDRQASNPLRPETFKWEMPGGAPPSYRDTSTGLTDTAATKIRWTLCEPSITKNSKKA